MRTIQRRDGTYRYLDRSKADLVVAADGQPVKNVMDLLEPIENKKPGEKVVFTIVRDGKQMDVTVELAESTD